MLPRLRASLRRPETIEDAVSGIGMESNLLGMDVVEVAPPYDTSDVTALLGNRVVLEALSGVAVRRKDDR